MALSIRNRSVEDKVRLLASRRRTSLTQAIEQAVDNELARQSSKEEAFLARIRDIQERVAKLPDTRLSEDEIMGWDENGLPT